MGTQPHFLRKRNTKRNKKKSSTVVKTVMTVLQWGFFLGLLVFALNRMQPLPLGLVGFFGFMIASAVKDPKRFFQARSGDFDPNNGQNHHWDNNQWNP